MQVAPLRHKTSPICGVGPTGFLKAVRRAVKGRKRRKCGKLTEYTVFKYSFQGLRHGNALIIRS